MELDPFLQLESFNYDGPLSTLYWNEEAKTMYKWVQYFLQRESFHLKYRIFSFINSDRYTIFTALWLFSYKAGSYLFDIGPESLRLLSYEFYGFFFVLQRESFNYDYS